MRNRDFNLLNEYYKLIREENEFDSVVLDTIKNILFFDSGLSNSSCVNITGKLRPKYKYQLLVAIKKLKDQYGTDFDFGDIASRSAVDYIKNLSNKNKYNTFEDSRKAAFLTALKNDLEDVFFNTEQSLEDTGDQLGRNQYLRHLNKQGGHGYDDIKVQNAYDSYNEEETLADNKNLINSLLSRGLGTEHSDDEYFDIVRSVYRDMFLSDIERDHTLSHEYNIASGYSDKHGMRVVEPKYKRQRGDNTKTGLYSKVSDNYVDSVNSGKQSKASDIRRASTIKNSEKPKSKREDDEDEDETLEDAYSVVLNNNKKLLKEMDEITDYVHDSGLHYDAQYPEDTDYIVKIANDNFINDLYDKIFENNNQARNNTYKLILFCLTLDLPAYRVLNKLNKYHEGKFKVLNKTQMYGAKDKIFEMIRNFCTNELKTTNLKHLEKEDINLMASYVLFKIMVKIISWGRLNPVLEKLIY